MRVLLDVNILISFLLAKNPDSPIVQIVRAAATGAFTLLLPDPLMAELRHVVLSNPQLSRRITDAHLGELAVLLSNEAEVVAPISEAIPAVTRDPKDDYLLAYALVGRADFLVTGDRDLLALPPIEGLKIVQPVVFARLLKHDTG
jgi:hypothetical protein